tara:strand:+ start:341 stop:727 length:387 start_codon:yes stop_codon:yes gene_type:complete
MKIFSTIALLVFSICLSSCLDKRTRSFFADEGIIVGDVKKVGQGDVFIPISFKTAIIHSAQIFHDIEWSEENGVIYITAIYNEPPFSKKIKYSGGIVLKNPKLKIYDLKYKDPKPDKATHDIGRVEIP